MDRKWIFSCLFTLSIFLSSTHGYSDTEKTIKISVEDSEITSLDGPVRYYPLGHVKGARPCGGPGKFLDWRYATCKSVEPICAGHADGVLRISQLDFIPSSNITQLGARFVVKTTDGTISASTDEGAVPSCTPIEQGGKYTITVPAGPSSKLKGKSGNLQYILYRIDNNEVEVCAEAFVTFK